MTTQWRSFLTRAVSALVALALLITLFVTLHEQGIKYAIIAVVLVGTYELKRLLFHSQPKTLQVTYALLSLTVFATTISSLSTGTLFLALSFVVFIIVSFIKLHQTAELEQILLLQSKATMAILYTGLLPAFSYRIIDQSYGLYWFVFLLATVFSGDTFAYIFGITFGKHHMMPRISPKKTWQGSFGGLFGSAIAATICHFFLLTHIPLVYLVCIAVLASFCGQYGDFFESLLKRVSGVKDSGNIMPGHGGILDRVDAVLFASPVILTAILIMSHLFI